MRILWPNVCAFGLVIFALWLGLSQVDEVKASFATINEIGSGDPAREVRGLCVLGVIGAILIAVLRIVIAASNREEK